MRYISMKERQKRGCLDCVNKVMRSKGIACPYAKCPYRELDKYENYNDFIGEKEDIVGLLLREPPKHTQKRGHCYQAVMVVETGQIFNSVVEAAKTIGVHDSSIHQALRHPSWRCGGYHWVRVHQ